MENLLCVKQNIKIFFYHKIFCARSTKVYQKSTKVYPFPDRSLPIRNFFIFRRLARRLQTHSTKEKTMKFEIVSWTSTTAGKSTRRTQRFAPEFGGWITTGELGNIQPYSGELYAGLRAVIGPFDHISRECWGAAGTVEKHKHSGKWFLRFDQPRKSVGALLTGLHIEPRDVVG